MKHWHLILLFHFLFFNAFCQQSDENNERGLKIKTAKTNYGYKNKYALIVGINNYLDDKIPPLQFAVNDAKEISQTLINNLGFEPKNVIVLLDSNATRHKILDTIQSTYINDDKIDENSQLLVYFAGHGTVSKSGNKGFLLNYDAKEGSELSTAISMDEVGRIASECKSKHVLFLIDACYGGFSRTRSGNGAFIKNVWNLKSREVITAGSSEEKVIESSTWQHSSFTKVLLDALQKKVADVDNDNILTSHELFGYLEQRVAAYSQEKGGKQTPQYGKLVPEDGTFFLELQQGALVASDENKQLLNEDEISEKLFSKIKINSNVNSARVFIDNREIGYLNNGSFEYKLKAGFYKFELRLDKYENSSFESYINPDTTIVFNVNLESKFSKVNFNIIPSDAAVIINNNLIGTGSFTAELPKGRHEILIEKKGFRPERTLLNLVQNETYLKVEIFKILSSVDIKTSPAQVFVIENSDTLGVTPLKLNLNYGKHNLILAKKNYLSKNFPLDILESGNVSHSILMVEEPEFLVNKEFRKLRSKNMSRFFAYGGLAFTSFIGAKAIQQNINKNKVDLSNNNFSLETYNSLKYGFYGLSGIFTLASSLNIVKFFSHSKAAMLRKKLQETSSTIISFKPNFNGLNLKVNVSI